MQFFLDENFPKKAKQVLESKGYEVLDIRGTDREGMDDASIFAMAQENEAIFLTTDRDFFHTIPFLHPNHHGIIVVALRQPNAKLILEKLDLALAQLRSGILPGFCLMITDNRLYSWSGN